MGSTNGVNHGMATYGADQLIANSTLGGDVLLGQTTIDGDGGLFYAADIEVDNDIVSHIYFRLFNSVGPDIEGNVHWMTSSIYLLNDPGEFGVIEQEITDSYSTTKESNFAVIPEPGVAALFFTMLAVMVGATKSFRTGKTAGGLKRVIRYGKKI